MQIFGVYQSVLKRGLFWYYLESTKILPVVHTENRQPCGAIYNRNWKGLLFDVSYYRNRVNLEIFHALSDGTGAMHFLRTLMTKYLSLCHHLNEPQLPDDASKAQMSDDSFNRYYTGSSGVKRDKGRASCCLRGRKYPDNRLKIITGLVGIQPLLDAAHRYNTTLTVFLCACLMKSISETVPVRSKRKPIVIDVPVNLRNFFPSASARNFFSVLAVSCNFWKCNGTLEEIIQKIKDDFSKGLSNEHLRMGFDAYSALEHNVFARITPLALKDVLLKAAYRRSERLHAASFSNIGIVSMPDTLKPFIRSFDVCSSTNQLQVCLCTFQGRLSISFSTPFINSEIQRQFFRSLAELGAEIEITTNPARDAEDEP